MITKSISTGAQHVTLDNKTKCLGLAVFFFWGNPTNKPVTGTAYPWELLIGNRLDQSLWSTHQTYWATVTSNLLHSFLEVHNSVAPFTSHGKLQEFGAEKPISWAKPAHFDFFTINFIVCSHILSTGGDALRGHTQKSKGTSVGAGSPLSAQAERSELTPRICTIRRTNHLWNPCVKPP